jgi:hypothetical protein
MEIREALAREARLQAATDIYQQAELTRTLDGLAAAGVTALLFKGTALAHTLYSKPWLRPRCDTDLVIREDHLEQAREVLNAEGYGELLTVGGELINYQTMFSKKDGHNPALTLDVHWRIANPQRFANVLAFDEMLPDAQPVPALGPRAMALGNRHALLVACLHRVAHHYEDDRLIWLYDIHLLSGTMTECDWGLFFQLARERHVDALCARGIEAARTRLRTSLPAATVTSLVEITGADLKRHPTRAWQLLFSDLKSLPNWRNRLQLLREHLVPAPSYMLAKYGHTDRRLLPVLYVRRALMGSWKLGRRLRPTNRKHQPGAT